MSLTNAINFITCIFIYEPLRHRVTNLDAGDADGLLKLATQLGYNLSDEEMLLALELTVEHLILGDAPAPEEILNWVQERRARWHPSQPFQVLMMRA